MRRARCVLVFRAGLMSHGVGPGLMLLLRMADGCTAGGANVIQSVRAAPSPETAGSAALLTQTAARGR
jgi:hypothetical protein